MTERYTLPVWIRNGLEVNKLANGFGDWWDKVEEWLKSPLNYLDPETCSLAILKLWAYQRDVDLFANESEELFRQRVVFAIQNTIDAGSKEGFSSIFARFGWPLLGQIERDPDKDWDVVTLWLGDSTITSDPELGQYLIQQFGRTCRRYEFLNVDEVEPLYFSMQFGSVNRQYDSAS